MDTQSALFDLGPARPRRRPSKPLVEIGAPLWTADKSRLIDEYIHHFLLITKHGVYLDLFAGPQRPDRYGELVCSTGSAQANGGPGDSTLCRLRQESQTGATAARPRAGPSLLPCLCRRCQRACPRDAQGRADHLEDGVFLPGRPAHLSVPLGHRRSHCAAQTRGLQDRAVLLSRARLDRPRLGEYPGIRGGWRPGGATATTSSFVRCSPWHALNSSANGSATNSATRTACRFRFASRERAPGRCTT